MTHSAPIQNLRPGAGTFLSVNGAGACVSNPHPGVSFNHPWLSVIVVPSAGQYGLRIGKGVVDNLEPTINGRPMSGSDTGTAPILKLAYSEANQTTNESWAVLVVEPNDKGSLDADSGRKIVHASSTPIPGTQPRIALAMIQWKNKQPVAVWPCVFFNFRYKQTGTGSETVRHYFL